MKFRTLLFFVLPGLMVGLSGQSFAQDYPSRPIRVVVPSSPGGAHDIIARFWTDRIRSFGTFVVENRSGAGSILGTIDVSRGTPDGYLLLMGSTNTHVLQPLVSKQATYDPLGDFSPISILATTKTAIAINPKIPARSLKEFIEYARANPGKLTLGHSGPGTNTFLSGELFKQLAGDLDIVSIPYKGAGPSFADLVTGQIQLIVVNVTSQVIAFHKTEKIRLLAVNSPVRLTALPDVPTSAEAGLPGMLSETFYATFAPAKTPSVVLEKLDGATQTALADAGFRAKLVASGFDPVLKLGPKEAPPYIKAEYDRWVPLVKRIQQNQQKR